MKTKLRLAFFLLVVPFAAAAQGKIMFGNNSERLYVLHSSLLRPQDAALAGQLIPDGPLPSGVILVAGLYAGTSSTSLTLQSSTTLLTGTGWWGPGRQANRPTALSVPGGVPQWFRIAIWDSAVSAPNLSHTYVGYSPLFRAVPGTSITYPFIYITGSPTSSTWAPGNIVVSWVLPEPSAFALFSLGLLGFIQLRRKPS